MLQRLHDRNRLHTGPVNEAAAAIERDGHYLLRGVFTPTEVEALRAEVLDVYRRVPCEMRDSAITPAVGEMYRYQMFNHSPLCQAAIARAEILDALEPLLGYGLHVIACTSWKNPPGPALTPNGSQWHVDGGPHVPFAENVRWPAYIPFPIFVVASQIYLQDVALEDGPTACIPGSHRSGRVPPEDRLWDLDLTWDGNRAVHHVAKAGDVDFRVSDVWHRRWPPTQNAAGRLFLQTNYARRDIAQRLLPTEQLNAVHPDALARATSDRERRLLGLHPQNFFDS